VPASANNLDRRSLDPADPDRARAYAVDLVSLNPDVILAQSSLVLLALQRETRTIPIVFVQVNDPVGSGIVASLAHPGGNITGFTPVEFSIGGKLLEVLKEAAPAVTQVAVFLPAEAAAHPEFATQVGMWRAIEAVAPSLGVRLTEALRGRDARSRHTRHSVTPRCDGRTLPKISAI
jgi:ABC-type uncharacterized transport system substrate-binding protein